MKRYAVLIVGVVAAAFLFSAGCEKVQMNANDEAGKAPPTAKAEGQPEAQTPPPATANAAVPTIVIHTANGAIPFSVEIAESDEERARGLIGRESLADNAGMWFIFPQMIAGAFHMNGMTFPLDWIFVDDTMKINHIKENNPPTTNAEPYTAPVQFKYVLELKAGTVAKDGIKVGDAVEKKVGP